MGELIVNQSRMTVTQDVRRSNNITSVKPGQAAPDNNQNEPPQLPQTRRSTTDQQPPKVTKVTAPFKLIPVVPPKKSIKIDMNLRIEPEARRPLPPIPNSTSHTRGTKDRQFNCNPAIQCENQTSEPSENEAMDFESIDERTLPMLTDNCDETSSLQPKIRCGSEESITLRNQVDNLEASSQSHLHIRGIEDDVTKSDSAMQVTSLSQPSKASMTVARQEVESSLNLSTLNGPPGLLIGERINIEGVVSPLPKSDVRTNESLAQPEITTISIRSSVHENQQLVRTSLEDPNKQIDEDQLPINFEPDLHLIISQNVNITSESSTLQR